MMYINEKEKADEIASKYNLPTQIESYLAEGKVFYKILETEYGFATVFKDNTFVYMRVSGDYDCGYDCDEEECDSKTKIELFRFQFPKAKQELDQWRTEQRQEKERERKYNQFLELQKEFGN